MRAIERGVSASEPMTGRGGGQSGGWGQKFPAEHRPVDDGGGLEPGGQRPHRAEFGAAVGQRHQHGVGLRALAARQGEFKAMVGVHEVTDKFPASSNRRSAPAKPTNRSARSRTPRRSSGIDASSLLSGERRRALLFRVRRAAADASLLRYTGGVGGGGNGGRPLSKADRRNPQLLGVAGLAVVALARNAATLGLQVVGGHFFEVMRHTIFNHAHRGAPV